MGTVSPSLWDTTSKYLSKEIENGIPRSISSSSSRYKELNMLSEDQYLKSIIAMKLSYPALCRTAWLSGRRPAMP
jgi:hypothetical protein